MAEGTVNVSEPSTKDMLEHAWRYFAIHAGQRISLFNFFIIVAGTMSAGLAACLQQSGLFSLLGVGLGCLLMLVAFIFWKLDQRTALLVKHAEAAIAEIEKALPIPAARVLSREPSYTVEQGEGSSFARAWTYGKIFRIAYLLMALIGVVGAVLCLSRLRGWM